MVNIIWLFLFLCGIIVAAFKGDIQVVTEAVFDSAEAAVKISFGLIAVMTFWLGMMKLAEEAGLVELLAKIVRPLTGYLFPSIPENHPAMGAIILNLSANFLGLGNAATPMGLIAMKELQKLNSGDPATATDAMITFLALNTACITLIPATVIGLRIQAGSANPTEIVGTTLFATTCGTIVAVLSDKILCYLGKRKGRI